MNLSVHQYFPTGSCHISQSPKNLLMLTKKPKIVSHAVVSSNFKPTLQSNPRAFWTLQEGHTGKHPQWAVDSHKQFQDSGDEQSIALVYHQFALHPTHNSPYMSTQDALLSLISLLLPVSICTLWPSILTPGSTLIGHREVPTAICKRNFKACNPQSEASTRSFSG